MENAKAFLDVQKEHGVLRRVRLAVRRRASRSGAGRQLRDVPATTPESDALSKALRERGFRFVGSTICYAFMQACGMVNDHVQGCFLAKRR